MTLSECANITDLGLQKFAQQCKDIERLDISHCMVGYCAAYQRSAICDEFGESAGCNCLIG